MFVEGYPSEQDTRRGEHERLGGIRVRGGISLAVARFGELTRITDLEERGGYRAKFPKGEYGVEAVTINTGGGLVGGDEVEFAVRVGEGAAATIASQSAERIYRALSGAARVRVTLTVAARGELVWLPQETILYDGARLDRHVDVDVAGDATLLMSEAAVFGREAMGEHVRSGTFRDRWMIRRDGVPTYVEAVSFEGCLQAQLQRAAIGAGARAAATVLYVARDAEERRDAVRATLGPAKGRAAVSAWNGMLVGRFLAPDAAALRQDLTRVLSFLARKPMPRVWNC